MVRGVQDDASVGGLEVGSLPLQPSGPGRGGRRRLLIRNGLALLLLLALALLPLASDIVSAYTYAIQICMTGLMWLMFSTSWNILGGFTGLRFCRGTTYSSRSAPTSPGNLLVMVGRPLRHRPDRCVLCVVLGIIVGFVQNAADLR